MKNDLDNSEVIVKFILCFSVLIALGDIFNVPDELLFWVLWVNSVIWMIWIKYIEYEK